MWYMCENIYAFVYPFVYEYFAQIYQYLEVCLVPDSGTGSQFPGLFLFSADSRMMRPVINLTHKRIEYIGTFEQVYLNIAIRMSEIDAKVIYDFLILSHLYYRIYSLDRQIWKFYITTRSVDTNFFTVIFLISTWLF